MLETVEASLLLMAVEVFLTSAESDPKDQLTAIPIDHWVDAALVYKRYNGVSV